jgi:hypothetical protein
MAQKDAKVNIELAVSSATIAKASKDDSAIMRQIAIETKRDSAAMKTIALLGMFFLPGTFVAVSWSFFTNGFWLTGVGDICDASFQLGWRWHARYYEGIQVLLGCDCAFDYFGAPLLGSSYATSVERLDIEDQRTFPNKRTWYGAEAKRSLSQWDQCQEYFSEVP